MQPMLIAEQIAGSQDAFVEMMNQEAQKIGATNTHFVNANGLHSEDHYTTVYDLYLMFNAAMQHEEFLQMLQEKEYQASYQAADGTTVEAVWSTTNQFTKGDVTVPDGVTAVGGKTGTTTAAMSCLVQLLRMHRENNMWQLSLVVRNVESFIRRCRHFCLI